ncbi:hypothetical protein B0T22DRAFT_81474 [Podospora appendiculata]|uniref:Uncharacterized protein n=1 Tax=Podospora appendiculata TaxID=314037 RepID=A0AAE0XJX6_9PEZI|nr:hypothetical protein B0T22DRAFT_81474 [Podospora appendiculata]
MAGASFKLPQFSQTDLHDFHEAHFSKRAIERFGSDFLRPDVASPAAQEEDKYAKEEYYEEDDDDDGLGYYPDGVKRTLTDEQIAIFRHSELEALRRANESSRLKRATTAAGEMDEDTAASAAYLSEGEVSSSGGMPAVPKKKKKNNNKRKRGKNHKGEGEPPMDLRKRTWDVVDQGLATLDYGDEEGEAKPVQGAAMQRRRISYED